MSHEGLDEVCDVHWHLVDASVIELFNVVESAFVIICDKVDGDALATKSPAASNPEKIGCFGKLTLNVNESYDIPMDVVLPVCGEVIVDNERNLLDINAPGEQIRGDENARRA